MGPLQTITFLLKRETSKEGSRRSSWGRGLRASDSLARGSKEPRVAAASVPRVCSARTPPPGFLEGASRLWSAPFRTTPRLGKGALRPALTLPRPARGQPRSAVENRGGHRGKDRGLPCAPAVPALSNSGRESGSPARLDSVTFLFLCCLGTRQCPGAGLRGTVSFWKETLKNDLMCSRHPDPAESPSPCFLGHGLWGALRVFLHKLRR